MFGEKNPVKSEKLSSILRRQIPTSFRADILLCGLNSMSFKLS